MTTKPRILGFTVALGALLAGLALLTAWQGRHWRDKAGSGTPPAEPPSGEAIEPSHLSREDLLRLPEGFRRELEQALRTSIPGLTGTDPQSEQVRRRGSTGPDWLAPSLTVDSERVEGPNPSVGVRSTEVKAGVTVSPGRPKPSPGDVSVSVEGGMRQEVSEKDPDAPHRSHSVGVRVEVPWPPQRDRKVDRSKEKN